MKPAPISNKSREEIERLATALMHRCEEARNLLFHIRYQLWVDEELLNPKQSIQELTSLFSSNLHQELKSLENELQKEGLRHWPFRGLPLI